MISGRPHVSYETTYVLASIPSLALLTDERSWTYLRRPEDAKEEERLETLRKWQGQWDRSTKGRWTHRLIPNIRESVERKHGEVNYQLIQLLFGHGYFKRHSQRYDKTINAQCPTCPHMVVDPEHVFFHCLRFDEERKRLNDHCQEEIRTENIIGLMLTSESNWQVVASFAHAVVTRLKNEEITRKR
uniref:Reverse transcriptase zinc-binding domain-containing protein n=1 Tax=Trichogramma kaykai TaxID=54128 RepID=A0ABD2WMV6_9HYME